jgi:hypothetical protein
MVTPVSSKVMGTHNSPSAAQDADLVRLFENLLEDEETEEVFREFTVPERRRQTRFPWFLPSRSTLDYPNLFLPQFALPAPPPMPANNVASGSEPILA